MTSLASLGEFVFNNEATMADLPLVNIEEIDAFSRIAQSDADGPVFMLNLNKYNANANANANGEFPDGQLYSDYMTVLDILLAQVAEKVLWRTKVLGHVVGKQDIDEAIGIWYPSHKAFLNLMTAPASSENMRLREKAVAHADLHRCATY